MKIPIENEETFEPVVVPNNVYNVKVKAIKEKELKYGETLIFDFEITEGKEKGKIVSGFANKKLNPGTKLWDWTSAMGLTLEAGKQLETDDLIGCYCRILTETITVESEGRDRYKTSRVKELLEVEEITNEPTTE